MNLTSATLVRSCVVKVNVKGGVDVQVHVKVNVDVKVKVNVNVKVNVDWLDGQLEALGRRRQRDPRAAVAIELGAAAVAQVVDVVVGVVLVVVEHHQVLHLRRDRSARRVDV